MQRIVSLLVFILLLTYSCRRPGKETQEHSDNDSFISLDYANGFKIECQKDYSILTVLNPWQNSENIKFSYVLGKEKNKIPKQLENLPFIKVPVARVVTLSTTHIAFIDTLNGIGSICGISGKEYAYNRDLRREIEQGKVQDVGYDMNLNYELLIDLDPDVIFMYGVEGSITGTLGKLKDLGLSAVMCGDYLESNPLGKAEWIKFFGKFYDCADRADSIFWGIEAAYDSVKNMAAGYEKKPVILSGLPWKNTWYVPGGRSFAAGLIRDAGGNYLWAENLSHEALPLDLESVYLKALKADIWINPGDAVNLEEIVKVEERFLDLPVFKSGKIYNNNRRINDNGGNDYWESGALRPDLILLDLVSVFHPDSESPRQFYYYKNLK